MSPEQTLNKIADAFAASGRNIEAGWIKYQMKRGPPDLTEEQWRNARTLFFSGAQCLFGLILQWSDETYEMNEEQARTILSQVYNELISTNGDLHGPTAGNA